MIKPQAHNYGTSLWCAALLPLLALTACGGEGTSQQTTPVATSPAPAPAPSPPPTSTPAPSPTDVSIETSFTNVTMASGLSLPPMAQVDFGNPEIGVIFPHGIAAGDYDNDGDIDFFIARADRGANHLFRNLGNMQFEDVAMEAGVAFTRSATDSYLHGSPVFADLNADGNLDILIPGLEQGGLVILISNGDGTFVDMTDGSGLDTMNALYTHSPALGDYDLDGDLDIFFGHWGNPPTFNINGDTEHLWRNDSDASGLRFTSVSIEAQIAPIILSLPDPGITQRANDFTFSPSFVRINDDEWPDIVIAADFGFSQIFINRGDGTFANTTDFDVIIDGNGMGSAVGDYDNDGDLDWFVSSIMAVSETENPPPSQLSQIGNRLYRNNAGVFEDVTDSAGVADGGWGWGSCFMDFENDGDLDIYHTNGWPTFEVFGNFPMDTSRAFISNGAGAFSNEATALGLDDTEQGRGIVCGDFDNDGDIDILQLHRNTTNALSLWENTYFGQNQFVKIRLRGDAPNVQAIGARITISAAGKTYIREVNLGNNFASHNAVIQHFGLGTANIIDSINISWPDGSETMLSNIGTNQTLTISQSS